MDERQKAYNNESWLVGIWTILIIFLGVNPLVYWKGITDVSILGFKGQYGFYLLVMIFILPPITFIGAYLGNKVEAAITSFPALEGDGEAEQSMGEKS